MFDQVFENLKKATESSIQMQQEMFQKFAHMVPGATTSPLGAAMPNAGPAVEAFQKWQHRWEETVSDLFRRQRELVDSHYAAGLKSLENLFQVGEAKSPQEYQEKVVELYKKSFESLRQLSESQLKEFKSAAEKWAELMTKTV